MQRPAKPRPPPISLDKIKEKNASAGNRLDDFFSRPLVITQFNPDELEDMVYLGRGIGGSVFKVKHKPTNRVLARKQITIEVDANQRKLILQELEVLKDCKSPHIVDYFGACYNNGEINLFMEYMDGRSLEYILSRVQRIEEDILSKVSLSVVKGLAYLRDSLNIIHRDIKPSNILVNSLGQIKLCDFGVSGRLTESLAQSFVGTSYYMAPERLEGNPYAVQSDIWSLGLSLVELALGMYPIPQEDPVKMYYSPRTDRKNMPIFELMQSIVHEPPPTVPGPPIFTDEFKNFIDRCLKKNPSDRFDLRSIFQHPFLMNAETSSVNVDVWVCQVCVNAPIDACPN